MRNGSEIKESELIGLNILEADRKVMPLRKADSISDMSPKQGQESGRVELRENVHLLTESIVGKSEVAEELGMR